MDPHEAAAEERGAGRRAGGQPEAGPGDLVASPPEGAADAQAAEVFFKGLLHAQIERSEAVHGAAWLPATAPGEAARLLCEEPARVGERAAESWRLPLGRQAALVFLEGARRIDRVSEPADRMLQGWTYWSVGLPVPVGQVVAAVVTLVVVGGERQVHEYARVAAESVASQGLLFGTQEAARVLQQRYDELCRAWNLVAATNIGYPDPEHIALALVNKGKEFLGASRVSLGWVRRGKVRLAAISEQDYIDRRTNLSRALTAAMKEAVEAERAILFPPAAEEAPPGEASSDVYPAHAALADLTDDYQIATYPLRAGEETVAAVVFERRERQPLTGPERRVQSIACEQLGPALGLAKQNARGVFARCRDGGVALAEALLGKGRVTAKIVAIALLLLVALGVFGRWTMHISGTASLVPATRRVYAAPFDHAILRETPVLPGQLVSEGTLLFRFEDQELQLSLREARSRLAAAQAKAQVSLAEQKMADYKVAQAESEELIAQIALLEQRIRQARVEASFDGVVLSGDLRQQIGSPFQMGQTLLEVAPLKELLLLVQVDQGDIAHVQVGQEGTFVTRARPDKTLSFTVEKIRPMAEVHDQANVFIVEARIPNPEGWLRPGMEAAANIRAGEHNITYVWTRKLVNWVRLKLLF
ncbi:MAG TPA: efflux RND transporter periplasmic adaptor subunit [Planctomycetota bacterium]|nr:efflux RND transporter periplasmic adaptor subunit [Planctomycetota bacterium]HRR81133.1 efflux RND transporter periplasmic adaptor subunit [Planctomycetota bacterium]HRT94695.1 efflux RND transporter periplasmic adaptor subunit [Planctomycetota bacterium]